MFSILIPVYNVDVSQLVQTLYEQANRLSGNFQIIVCDDGSTDEKIQQSNRNVAILEHIIYLENTENCGRLATRNRLAETAQHPWLLFLDADVIPPDEYFLNRYFTYFNQTFDVVTGGFTYSQDNPDSQFSLRCKFGRKRESISASERNRQLYRVFISANYLIRKTVYIELLSHLKTSVYGADNLIAAVFLKNKTSIFHIDNPVIHLGLESNKVFLKKSREAIDSLLLFLQNNPDFQSQNKLFRTFLTVKKLRLVNWVDFVFCLNRKQLEKHLLEKNPSLLLFDLYRLGYLCHIHH